MSLAKFKRILPKLPTLDEQREVYEAMLLEAVRVIHTCTPEEQDELLGPDIAAPEAEFYDNVCPECGAHRTSAKWMDREWARYMTALPPKFGHYGFCKRARKYYKYVDCWDGIYIRWSLNNR